MSLPRPTSTLSGTPVPLLHQSVNLLPGTHKWALLSFNVIEWLEEKPAPRGASVCRTAADVCVDERGKLLRAGRAEQHLSDLEPIFTHPKPQRALGRAHQG